MQQTRWPVASINIVTGSYPKQVQYARVEAEIYIILFILLSSFYEQIIIKTFIAMEYSQKHTWVKQRKGFKLLDRNEYSSELKRESHARFRISNLPFNFGLYTQYFQA